MNSDQPFLDSYNAHEDAVAAADWKQKRAALQRYEQAAKEAHKVRMTANMVNNRQVVSWDDMSISGQRHLIADAENVAKNPSITESELKQLYLERLIASGDSENPDLLETWDEESEITEKMVLERLKAVLSELP